jgi:hypothetical protein
MNKAVVRKRNNAAFSKNELVFRVKLSLYTSRNEIIAQYKSTFSRDKANPSGT